MKNISVFKDTVETTRNYNILKPETKTDVLIIGGGIAGMSVALSLLENKVDFLLLDKGKVGMGITGNSTGKLTFAQGYIYDKLLNMYDYKTAYKYYQSQVDAIKMVRKNVEKYKMKCDFADAVSYIIAENDADVEKIRKEELFYRKAKVSYHRVYELPNHFPLQYGISFEGTATFHPVKYVLEIKKILEKHKKKIYENTTVHELQRIGDGYIVETDRGEIYAKKVVVCTHYPFFITPGLIPFRTHIEKSYVLSSSVNSVFPMSAITPSKPTYSMRYLQSGKHNYFIFATNSHLTATTFDLKRQFDELISKYNLNFREKIDYIWSTHDVMTNDNIPYIGFVNENHPNLFIATGFNKWGMTNGVLTGKLICDAILGKKNSYASIFSLQRKSNLQRTYQLIQNNVLTGTAFLSTKVVSNRHFYSKNVEIVEENGEKIGIYRTRGREYKVKNTCPHMKCSLIFNEFEKTWDCPCHGSRFDIKGNCICGPSTYSIKIHSEE